MPFYSRVVEPRHLGRRAGDEAALPLRHGVELRDGANRGLVGLLRQLGELSRHAEGVLAGLEEEASAVGGRAGLLAARVLALGTAVAVLDAKRVRVPVSSLEEGARQCDHYRSWRELQERVLAPETRPPCVWELHRDARSSLRAALTECDWLQGDGHPSSDLYSQGPTFASLPGGRASTGEDGEGAQEHDDAAHGGLLPTPEERMRRLAQNFPPHTVAIDVSGLGFDRQATVRRSYLGGDGTLKRRHNKAGASSSSSSAVAVMSSRRRTISGFPESLQQDLASVGSELRSQRGRSLYLHSAADVAAGGSGGGGKRDSQCQTDGACARGGALHAQDPCPAGPWHRRAHVPPTRCGAR
uniref:Nance-Horan syndrome protein-like n=1 Tax=Petromyzon marinus TaxID=7757 RepID=A0AAJ7UA04_PETMA|nr:Nance-Horan syndrome protein-like [Petromyzon marinus]